MLNFFKDTPVVGKSSIAIGNSATGVFKFIGTDLIKLMLSCYVNKAFEVIPGYSFDEAVGKNCRFLQGSDKDQSEINMLRKALKEKSVINVTLRNYKKNGELFSIET